MILPEQSRLKGSKLIESVKKGGKIQQSENFGVCYLNKDEKQTSRFAFIVSKKISKLAVNRNRINRAFNEGVRRCLKIIPKGVDFIFLAKREIANRSTEEIIKEVENFIKNFK